MDLESLSSILTAIDNFSDKIIEYQDKKIQIGTVSFKNIDLKMSRLNGITTKDEPMGDSELAYNLIQSSPSGESGEFALALIKYLDQRDNEMVIELSKQLLADLRDCSMIRSIQDTHNWDNEMRHFVQMMMIIGRNVNMAFRKEGEEKDEEESKGRTPSKELVEKEAKKEKSKKYHIS